MYLKRTFLQGQHIWIAAFVCHSYDHWFLHAFIYTSPVYVYILHIYSITQHIMSTECKTACTYLTYILELVYLLRLSSMSAAWVDLSSICANQHNFIMIYVSCQHHYIYMPIIYATIKIHHWYELYTYKVHKSNKNITSTICRWRFPVFWLVDVNLHQCKTPRRLQTFHSILYILLSICRWSATFGSWCRQVIFSLTAALISISQNSSPLKKDMWCICACMHSFAV